MWPDPAKGLFSETHKSSAGTITDYGCCFLLFFSVQYPKRYHNSSSCGPVEGEQPKRNQIYFLTLGYDEHPCPFYEYRWGSKVRKVVSSQAGQCVLDSLPWRFLVNILFYLSIGNNRLTLGKMAPASLFYEILISRFGRKVSLKEISEFLKHLQKYRSTVRI